MELSKVVINISCKLARHLRHLTTSQLHRRHLCLWNQGEAAKSSKWAHRKKTVAISFNHWRRHPQLSLTETKVVLNAVYRAQSANRPFLVAVDRIPVTSFPINKWKRPRTAIVHKPTLSYTRATPWISPNKSSKISRQVTSSSIDRPYTIIKTNEADRLVPRSTRRNLRCILAAYSTSRSM